MALVVVLIAWKFIVPAWQKSTTTIAEISPLIAALAAPVVALGAMWMTYVVVSRQYELNVELKGFKKKADAYAAVFKACKAVYRELKKLEASISDGGMLRRVDAQISAADDYSFLFAADMEGWSTTLFQYARELAAADDGETDAAKTSALWLANNETLSSYYRLIIARCRQEFTGAR